MDRDTKLIAILRRQYNIILTALGENIFRIGLRRFATPPNTEYIFSQLAVNIMWYCCLKIAISLYLRIGYRTPLDPQLVSFKFEYLEQSNGLRVLSNF